jgi:hypothetical protein
LGAPARGGKKALCKGRLQRFAAESRFYTSRADPYPI